MTNSLFEPLQLRGTTLTNRLVVSPMCQYSAEEGVANDWHFANLARFALGGFGAVFVEATAVSPEGRITHGDLGLWNDDQIAPLQRIAGFLKDNGAVPAIQLGPAGRRAAAQRPWEGDGPLTDADAAARGEGPWPVIAASAIPHRDGWQTPHAMTKDDLEVMRGQWRRATERALQAGFEIVEVHAAHGFLLNSFLSPLANLRNDDHGGDFDSRLRFPLEIVSIVREIWPADRPVFVRLSATDWAEGGWNGDDTVEFARRLKRLGVDVVDCSSGGVAYPKPPLAADYQTQFASRVHRETDMAAMAVGLIDDPKAAAALIAEGHADLVALAREALNDPNWPLHARAALGADPLDFDLWPVQAGHWLRNRARARLAQ
ncbi:NADH:flavin oxidoreductase/NADH oxidase [Pseudophaeobacter leonis]|uniref:NADH:flavin oxidoreductase/NADH oxidase n=1 Tax=Pseudophaeobacter leonis TaxID=1144477 RepID=UPI0009F5C4E0|nr:NADH:flavin oxidoreductase/NADH oxidase [Pseudophaeobacter leonis]